MSRSSELRPWCRVLALAGAGLVCVLTVCLAISLPAMADPTPPPPPLSGTARHAPVLAVIAPVLGTREPTADLRGYATVEPYGDGARIRLDSTLLFDRDSARLRPGARTRISDVARTIAHRGPGQVTITGYTDDLGSAAHGRRLSRRRAAAVADVLRRSLPPGCSFRVTGRGEADPAVPNSSEANRQKNRRVLVTYHRR